MCRISRQSISAGARRVLKERDFQLGQVATQISERIADTVLGQQPPANSTAVCNSAIDVLIAVTDAARPRAGAARAGHGQRSSQARRREPDARPGRAQVLGRGSRPRHRTAAGRGHAGSAWQLCQGLGLRRSRAPPRPRPAPTRSRNRRGRPVGGSLPARPGVRSSVRRHSRHHRRSATGGRLGRARRHGRSSVGGRAGAGCRAVRDRQA